MKLCDISLNSLWRRKTRMLFLLIGLTIAISTVVILVNVSRAMNADIAKKLDEYGANILIVPNSDELSLSYGGMTVSGLSVDQKALNDQDIQKIRTIKNKENISIVAPKLLSVAEVQAKTVMVVGVDFDSETALKKWWKIIGVKPGDEWEAIIGSEVKQKLNLGLNQTIQLKGETFKIAGILEETGSQDDGLIFIDLKKAQSLFHKPASVSLIEVAALCYDCPIEEIVAQTSEKLPGAKVTAIRQSIETKMETMHRFEHFSLGISAVILVIGALIAFTTMSASVNERKKEIGVFRSIGFRQRHIMQIIFLEALILSGIAGLAGYLLGWFVAVNAAPLVGAETLTIPVDSVMLLMALGLSLLTGVGATVHPAVKAARLDPTVALRAL
ncbi:MAG: ABC transporter permease [Calditrichaceae bacterium]|nr:ABC transporter permease [Calditrichia bacterium]NUQ40657.1 ABC transporter permease [Calditrichaceae bacterium]